MCGDIDGFDFSYRCEWNINRIKQLASVYAIHIAAYAIMSNHYHIVLRVDMEKALAWTDNEIIERWGQLHHLPLLVQRFCRHPSALDKLR